jgi:hypothetical protein
VILVGVEIRQVCDDPIPIFVGDYVPALVTLIVQPLLSKELHVLDLLSTGFRLNVPLNIAFLVVVESCPCHSVRP